MNSDKNGEKSLLAIVSSVNSENYLTRNYIMEYLNDAVQQLLEIKNSNQKVDILEYFTEYFNQVKQGNHIMFREYSFLAATPYNRISFLKKFLEIYGYMLSREDFIAIDEFHALISMISNDFPMNLITKSLKIIYGQDTNKMNATFRDFLNAFRFQFYFNEFLNDAEDLFNILDRIRQGKIERLDNLKLTPDQENVAYVLKNMTKKTFLETLEILNSKVSYSFPCKEAIVEALNKKENTLYKNFHELIKEIHLNEKIVALFGKLPSKSELAEKETNNYEIISNNKKDLSTNEISNIASSNESKSGKSQTNSSKRATANHHQNYATKEDQTDSNKSSSSDDSSDTDT